MGKNKNKKTPLTEKVLGPQGGKKPSPGGWQASQVPLPGPGCTGGGGLRPSWAGPRSECPLPPGEEGWLGGHCSPVRAPRRTWSPVLPTPADAAERAVQWGLAGGRVGKVAWTPQRAPAWASSRSSPGLKPRVYMGCQAHGASCSWGWPAPHSRAWIEAGVEAPRVTTWQPSGLPWVSAPSGTEPLRELLCA